MKPIEKLGRADKSVLYVHGGMLYAGSIAARKLFRQKTRPTVYEKYFVKKTRKAFPSWFRKRR